jgi:hypothetical protein
MQGEIEKRLRSYREQLQDLEDLYADRFGRQVASPALNAMLQQIIKLRDKVKSLEQQRVHS